MLKSSIYHVEIRCFTIQISEQKFYLMAFKYIVPSALLDSQYQGKTMKCINFAKIKSMQCFFLNLLATPRKAEWKEEKQEKEEA